MKTKALLAALVFISTQLLAQKATSARSGCDDKNEFLVREVILEDESHLSAKQVADLKSALVGRCFAESQLSQSADEIFRALKQQGYYRAWVQDPIVRVLDSTRQPKLVSLVFDVVPGPRKVGPSQNRKSK